MPFKSEDESIEFKYPAQMFDMCTANFHSFQILEG